MPFSMDRLIDHYARLGQRRCDTRRAVPGSLRLRMQAAGGQALTVALRIQTCEPVLNEIRAALREMPVRQIRRLLEDQSAASLEHLFERGRTL